MVKVTKAEDLKDDPVVQYLKLKIIQGNSIANIYLTEKSQCRFNEPRKILTIEVKNDKTGKISEYKYNYLKMFRELQKRLRNAATEYLNDNRQDTQMA